MNRREFMKGSGAFAAMMTAGCRDFAPSAGGKRWYKGMLHCHSIVSDGKDLPEQVIACYRDLGYDFFCLSDHNRLPAEAEWRGGIVEKSVDWPPHLEKQVIEDAVARFPWVKTRTGANGPEARLSSVKEYVAHFNDPGRFLIMPGTELTCMVGEGAGSLHVHVNYVNLDGLIDAVKDASFVKRYPKQTARQLIRELHAETERLAAAKGKPPHVFTLNHPHWRYYDVLPADLVENPEVRYFEVCNTGADGAAPEGLPGDGYDNDRFWDAVNARRAHDGIPLLYGCGTDDAHCVPRLPADLVAKARTLRSWELAGILPTLTPIATNKRHDVGDGFIRVRADSLTPAALFAAMERGDFTASSGIDVDDVLFDGRTLKVDVPAMTGVTARVRFIVTKRSAPLDPVKTIAAEKPQARQVPVFSGKIGETVKVVEGRPGEALTAFCSLGSDDLYIRARVETDLVAPYFAGKKDAVCNLHPRFCTCWTQPYRA